MGQGGPRGQHKSGLGRCPLSLIFHIRESITLLQCTVFFRPTTGLGQGRPCAAGDRRVRSYPKSGCPRMRAATPASGQFRTFCALSSGLSQNARHRDQLAMFRTLDFAVVRQFDFASPLP